MVNTMTLVRPRVVESATGSGHRLIGASWCGAGCLHVTDDLQPVALGLSTPAPANENSKTLQVIVMTRFNRDFSGFVVIGMA